MKENISSGETSPLVYDLLEILWLYRVEAAVLLTPAFVWWRIELALGMIPGSLVTLRSAPLVALGASGPVASRHAILVAPEGAAGVRKDRRRLQGPSTKDAVLVQDGG